ncbi:MAG: hypothetical protein ACSLEL_02080 [Candidatus Malihini olakiniferum]
MNQYNIVIVTLHQYRLAPTKKGLRLSLSLVFLPIQTALGFWQSYSL